MEQNPQFKIIMDDILKLSHYEIAEDILKYVQQSSKHYGNLSETEAIEIISRDASEAYKEKLHARIQERMQEFIAQQLQR